MQVKNYIHDISFIVIALNEEFAIQKCLNSIYVLDAHNCELICIDSGSSDNTIQIMKNFSEIIPNTRIYKIKGDKNASIARNIGINNATKDLLFFIDGDVEISREFLMAAIGKIHDFGAICGNLIDVEYHGNFHEIKNIIPRYKKTNEKVVTHTGGIFITKKSIVGKVGLFDEALVINEDVDYSLRIREISPILYVPNSMGKHHTIPYSESKRLSHKIKNQHGKFTGFLLRKHIRDKNIVPFAMSQSALFFGIPFYLFLFLCLIFFNSGLYVFVITMAIFFADMIYGFFCGKNLIFRIFIHYINPIFILIGFFGFVPKGELDYKIIKIR